MKRTSAAKTAWRNFLGRLPQEWVRSLYRAKIALKYHLRPRRGPKRVFFVICTPRSGSTLLISYLNSVPGVSFADEILNPALTFGVPAQGISKDAVWRHIRHSLNHCGEAVCGAKIFAAHLRTHGMDAAQLLEHFPGARLVVVYRGSFLEQYVSIQIARRTGRYQRTAAAPDEPPGGKVAIRAPKLLEAYRSVARFYRELEGNERLKGRAVWIRYEDLAADPQRLFERVLFPFLGVRPVPVKTDLVKMNPRPLPELIENYDEVMDLLREDPVRQEYHAAA